MFPGSRKLFFTKNDLVEVVLEEWFAENFYATRMNMESITDYSVYQPTRAPSLTVQNAGKHTKHG